MSLSRKTTMKIWRRSLATMMLIAVAAIGYTIYHMQSDPELPPEMILPLLQAKQGPNATELLMQNFSEAWTLSEDYLLATSTPELRQIEQEFDRRISAIDHELDRLQTVEDAGVEILVGNLLRLKNDFSRDAKTSFVLHRQSLGLES